jgi:acyl phosphate:glycerol-3-phosphate acyltransferase
MSSCAQYIPKVKENQGFTALTQQAVFRKFKDTKNAHTMPPTPEVAMFTSTGTGILAGLMGYTVGSFPTAYVLVRRKANIDIRSAGSGNVGALNSYEVTRSRRVGLIVLLTDFAKGSVAVLLARWLFGGQGGEVVVAAALAVLGHVASPWIGFRGGRGLATGAGALVWIAWPALGAWGAAWLVGFFLFRSVNPANALASCVTLASALLLPDLLVLHALVFPPDARLEAASIAAINLIILATLVKPVREYIAGRSRTA